MICTQNRDALYFYCIFEDSAVSHMFYQKLVSSRGHPKSTYRRGGVGGWEEGVSPKLYRCVHVVQWTVSVMSVIFVLFFFFSLWNMQILQILKVKINANWFLSNLRFILPSLVGFQGFQHWCLHLQVFITLHQSNSGLWQSLNFMQLQAMLVLDLNFRFVLDFDNSRIGLQFRNKFSLCKVNIALQTILSLRLCIAPAHE